MIQRLFLTSIFIGPIVLGMPNVSSAADRNLKLELEVGRINAQPVTLPNGEQVDFSWVANTLVYTEVFNSGRFAPMSRRAPLPSYADPLTGKSLSSRAPQSFYFNDSGQDEDQRMLAQYGFFREHLNPIPVAGISSSAAKRSLHSLTTPIAQAAEDSTGIFQVPSCVENLPLYRLWGQVESYGSSYGGKFCVGYGQNCGGGPSIGWDPKFGGTVGFSNTRLDMQFFLHDNFDLLDVAGGPGKGNQKSGSVGFMFNAGIPLGLNFFWQQTIADTVRGAIRNGLDNLRKDLKSKKNTADWNKLWRAMVIHKKNVDNGDTDISIRAGSNAGLAEGDLLYVTNNIYEWEGEPCQSPLAVTPTRKPAAIVKIEVVTPRYAVASVEQYLNGNERIYPGAFVSIESLVPAQ